MRRPLSWAALALLLVAREAPARSRLYVSPRDAIHLDDVVTVTLELDAAVKGADPPDLILENLEQPAGPRMVPEGFLYELVPSAVGAARIGPVEIWSDGRVVERLPTVALDVLPDLGRSGPDDGSTAARMAAARRPAVFVRAEAGKTKVVAGETVVVRWWVVEAATGAGGQLPRLVLSAPEVEGARLETSGEGPGLGEPQVLGGLVLRRRPLLRAFVTPEREGSLRVPAVTVLEEGPGASIRRRYAPEVLLEVGPRPVGAEIPIGTFTMQSGEKASGDPALGLVTVTIRGLGDLREAAAPVPRPEPEHLYLVRAWPPTLLEGPDPGWNAAWEYRFHLRGRPFVPPAFVLEAWDPALSRRVTLQTRPERAHAGAESVPPPPPKARKTLSPAIAAVLEDGLTFVVTVLSAVLVLAFWYSSRER